MPSTAGSAAPARPEVGIVEEPGPADVDRPLRLPDLAEGGPEAALAQGRGALEAKRFVGRQDGEPGALEWFLAAAREAPGNREAAEGIEASFAALMEHHLDAAREGRLDSGRRTEALARRYWPKLPALKAFSTQLAAAAQAERYVAEAAAFEKAGRLFEPAGANALQRYRRALAVFPGHVPAQRSLQRLARQKLAKAAQAADAEDFPAAEALVGEALRLLPGDPEVLAARADLFRRRDTLVGRQREAAEEALATLQVGPATAALTRIIALWPGSPDIEGLRSRIDDARYYGAFRPGRVFREILADGGLSPEMVVVPRGVFTMGADDREARGRPQERPSRQVRFMRGFAIATAEVTVAEFRRFVESTGYQTLATRESRSTVYDERGGGLVEHMDVDWRRDHAGAPAADPLPVVHVAYEDALAYANWLSAQTGQRYRLPSEAEWEYVLRAGRGGDYPWGRGRPGRLVGNLAGEGDRSPRLKRRWGRDALDGYRDGHWGPAEARSFPTEPFGTYDMVGNVAEWTEDCWHDSYRRAPGDGRAWVNPGCKERVLRGASWASAADHARSAHRAAAPAVSRDGRIGFRLVREI